MKKLLSNLSDNRATTAISLVSIWSLRLLKTKEKTEIRIILYLLGRQTSRQRFPYSSIFLYLFLKSFLIFYRYSYILLLLPWINSVQNIYLFQSHLEDLKVEKTKCSTWLARKKKPDSHDAKYKLFLSESNVLWISFLTTLDCWDRTWFLSKWSWIEIPRLSLPYGPGRWKPGFVRLGLGVIPLSKHCDKETIRALYISCCNLL